MRLPAPVPAKIDGPGAARIATTERVETLDLHPPGTGLSHRDEFANR